MEIKTITIEAYEFNELPQNAKYRAIQEYGQPPDDWHDEIINRAKDDGFERGFHIDNVQFSGFHSQGDGASWTGHIDFVEFITYHVKPDAKDLAQYTVLAELIKDGWCESKVAVSRSGFYYNHSGTMQSADIDDRLYYADEHSVVDKGILEGANVQELAKSIDYEELLVELGNWSLHKAQSYADEIYIQLRNEYDSYTSEEYFKDLCDINGWRFDKRGILIDEE
jgi:hypothetical protein